MNTIKIIPISVSSSDKTNPFQRPFSVLSSFSVRSFFSLIELIIVIAIMAVILSMLFPALSLSIQNTKSIQCANNLKQLTYGFIEYSDDYDGFFPSDVHVHNVYEHGGTNWAYWIQPYLENVQVLNCPESPDPAPKNNKIALHLYDGNYGWNFDGTQGKYGRWSTRISQPAQCYLLFDSGDQCITYWSNKWQSLLEELDLDWDSKKEGCNRHRNAVNITFADSHIESRELDAFIAAPTPSQTAPWFIKWSGNSILQRQAIPFPKR